MRDIARISSVQAVWRPELHRLGIGFGQDRSAAILTDIFGVVADEAVALAGDTMLDLAGGGDLEALLDPALGLEFGHFRLLLCDACGQPRQPIPAGPSLKSRKRAPLTADRIERNQPERVHGPNRFCRMLEQ